VTAPEEEQPDQPVDVALSPDDAPQRPLRAQDVTALIPKRID
jgi:hypothetical protein